MRENQLKKTLKAGDVALGTLMWEVKGRGVLHTWAARLDLRFTPRPRNMSPLGGSPQTAQAPHSLQQ